MTKPNLSPEKHPSIRPVTTQSKQNSITTRRSFLKTASAMAVAPYFIPSTSLGLGSSVAPSDRILMAAIGCGGKGRNNTKRFLNDKRVQFVAACDVDSNHLAIALKEINNHYKNQDCDSYEDFRELIARPDIDAVHVSTPDHWHAVASVMAMRKGKDVYCEKPLANSFGESKTIRDAAAQTGRILQCGSHERSNNNCRFAAELVRNGLLGNLESIQINMPCEQEHHLTARGTVSKPEPADVPKHLNWDFWQGHTKPTGYWEGGNHFWWRFILNYGGGEMTDRGAHIIDIAQLAMDADASGPVLFEAKGMQVKNSPYDAFWDYEFTNTYSNGVRMIGSTQGPRGLKFIGADGWLMVAIHGGALTASNPDWLPEKIKDGKRLGVEDIAPDDFKIKLGRSPGHHKNFIDCVISREPPMATAEIGHRTATICHLYNIAMRTGSSIQSDPQAEELINNTEAAKWLVPEMRIPWKV